MSLFVFGYGSLMWRPGFEFEDKAFATVRGRHRRLCVYSWVHRGTQERPGLVMGLDRGGACRGIVYRVADERRDEVVAYLRAREQVTMVYLEVNVTAQIDDGSTVSALTYVVDRKHPQYAGRLSLDETYAQVHGAVGQSGPNDEYVLSTADLLTEAGIADPRLHTLAERLRQRDAA
ncbi:gamma-glutamylcyclotransferase [Acuticoccus sediminis]|uniref:glutathione-specific gamma-glutamylcyclotransferase n=1 Tax=Acuticoccus sediminis TaxID=2184697 RepID=A0A8B2NNF4_9HYPH|nr:gamma-glutamylcyclotransferase [Acuticoccus sediminis]RAH98189.1 gamma-glutamylcyclotransferase [Acuticoccus sediminis]